MRLATGWEDYEIIATGGGEKLERWGDLILLRPDPQAIWDAPFKLSEYAGINAVYERSRDGGGRWIFKSGSKSDFTVSRHGLKFRCKLMGFKHTGLFPEQAVNWDIIQTLCKKSAKPKVLNLFAYTGGATVSAALAGAEVTHVDSAKAMCDRAKNNCAISGVPSENVRFIVDDCLKFIEREIRRGRRYDAVIMDPPSYGRGAGGEMWKLENNIFELVTKTLLVISSKPLFFLVNSYTTGLSPQVMKNIIDINFKEFSGKTEAYELGLPTRQNEVILPAGASALRIF